VVLVAALAAFVFVASGASAVGSASRHSAAVGPRLAELLGQPIPAEGLRIVVVLKRDDLPGRGNARRAAIYARQQRVLMSMPEQGFHMRRRFQGLSGFAMQADEAALNALRRHPETALLYLDGTVRATLAEGNALIGADAVHSSGYTAAGIKVAVLDTGIDTDHLDLAGDIVAQHCFCSGCCLGGANDATTAENMTDTARPSRAS
jgi:subtilisin family serine protease